MTFRFIKSACHLKPPGEQSLACPLRKQQCVREDRGSSIIHGNSGDTSSQLPFARHPDDLIQAQVCTKGYMTPCTTKICKPDQQTSTQQFTLIL